MIIHPYTHLICMTFQPNATVPPNKDHVVFSRTHELLTSSQFLNYDWHYLLYTLQHFEITTFTNTLRVCTCCHVMRGHRNFGQASLIVNPKKNKLCTKHSLLKTWETGKHKRPITENTTIHIANKHMLTETLQGTQIEQVCAGQV